MGEGERVTLHQDQAILSDKSTGAIGDCFRTTIANLLHLDRDSVPHFVRDHADPEDAVCAVNEFLRPFGLAYLHIEVCSGELKRWGIEGLNHERRGTSPRGVSHSVAACDDAIEHDPHPTHGGLMRSDDFRGVFIALRPWEMVKL
jgi:hypothetical protein